MAISTPAGYRALDEGGVAAYLAAIPALRSRLGGEPSAWQVREVGDGNLNLVFLVEGPGDDVCVKQALPYVRLVGEGWPLPLERAWYEHEAASIQGRHAPSLVPEMLHYDPQLFLMVMERLQPHIIMRRGTIQGITYPRFAEHLAEYLATTLYYTSGLALPAAEKKELIARFAGNTELCRITEDLIFTDPYMICDRNRWTSPQLDDAAAHIRADAALKEAVSFLKLKFLSEAQALLHGDLHTGSIMITPEDTRVIDPEFAFVGPMGFDVGKLIGNLLLSFFSQRGHEQAPGEREVYRRWLLATTEELWTRFERRFLALWTSYPTGAAFPRALFDGPSGRASTQRSTRKPWQSPATAGENPAAASAPASASLASPIAPRPANRASQRSVPVRARNFRRSWCASAGGQAAASGKRCARQAPPETSSSARTGVPRRSPSQVASRWAGSGASRMRASSSTGACAIRRQRRRWRAEACGPRSPPWPGRAWRRPAATPRASRRSATAPKDEPDRPGPSSTRTKPASGSPRRSRSTSGASATRRRNGCPNGRTVTGGGAPSAAATRAESPVPMLRMPTTRRGRSRGRTEAAAR